MRLRIHHLLILVLLTGCATIKPIPPETINKINRIGVVSILEDNLRMQYTGVVIWENYTEEIPVRNWKIDKYVASTFKNEMASHTNMSFLKVDCDIEPLLKANEKGNHKKLIINKLADIASKNKLDAIIFVKREWFYEPILHNVDVSGYGVCKQVEMASMYLVAHATIYDASTMESLARFSLIANKQVDKSYFTKDIHQLSDEQRNDIKTWVKTSIKEEIIEGLRKYGLLPTPDKPSQ